MTRCTTEGCHRDAVRRVQYPAAEPGEPVEDEPKCRPCIRMMKLGCELVASELITRPLMTRPLQDGDDK